MSSSVTRVPSTFALRRRATYASYNSSSEGENDTQSSSIPQDDEPASYPCNQLPVSLISRLNISKDARFDLLITKEFEDGSEDDDNGDDGDDNSDRSEETNSNSSSIGVPPCSIPYTTMEECIADPAGDVDEKSQPDSGDDSCSNFIQGWAPLPVQASETNNQCRDTNSYRSGTSSRTVMSSLKKRWRGVKKASVRSTAYFSTTRDTESKEDRHSRLGDEWVNAIIPFWRKKRKTARVRTLVFRGIPASVRGKVWCCAIGNPLNISEELFVVLKDRAVKGREEYLRLRDTVALADGDVGGHGGRAEAMMESERSAHKAISLDLPRTFPELSFFHAEGSHYEHALRDILEAFLYLKPDVGYSQGMSFVAAVLLLYMDPYDAFACFANMLLYKSCFLHFFRIKMPEVKCYLMVHDRLLAEDMPTLHAHFEEHGIEANLYMINWVMSLYCRALPLDLVTRIWDLYVLDGDIAIFRAALGILRMFMPKLLKMKFEEMAYFLSHIPADEIEPDVLLQSIRSVRVVTRKRFCDLFKECQMAVEKCGARR